MQEYYPSEAEIRLYESVSNYLMREGTYGIPERQRPPLSLLVRKILIPLQKEVMELSREHDALRRQIRKEHNATIKLQLKKEEMQMSRNLNQKRARMYALEDEYKDKVDEMTEKLQKEVNIKIHSEVMFRFKWHII